MKETVRTAPCVAIVGPANSGKTTFLHQLDRALQEDPRKIQVQVIKGSPDGTGRYLFHSPDLREPLKNRVKGSWQESTVEAIVEWIDQARQQLDLCLLDFGGKHDSVNDRMLARCSHFIVMAPTFLSLEEERDTDMSSWIEVCERNGLMPVALIRSLWQEGEAQLLSAPSAPILKGAFRADAAAPLDSTNEVLINVVAERLLSLCSPSSAQPYLDLNLRRDWTIDDLSQMGGLASDLDEMVAMEPVVRLGGRAPVWAYAAAMHRVLDRRSAAGVEVFDPKVADLWVEIPRRIESCSHSLLSSCVAVKWRFAGDWTWLDVRVTTGDRILPFGAPEELDSVPLPLVEAPLGPLAIFGALPVWLHLTYSRWLRSLPGERHVGAWDARLQKVVVVHGDP